MGNLTPLFIALTGIAVLLQALLLGAMYLAMRKSSARMEALATEVKTKALPTIEQAQLLLTEIRPKLQVIADNLQQSTTLARAQVERVDATVNDVIDRARLQIIRADESYRHAEGNSPAHIKATLTGSMATVLVESGRLVLGTWQGIFFCEYDGPRRRQVKIKFLKG